MTEHVSSCAVHNEPAYPAGPCDCGGLLPAGQVEMAGKIYMPRADGAIVPLELVKDEDLLRDQLVRELMAEAEAVSAQLAVFKARVFTNVHAFLDMIAEKYGAKARPGGDKGNVGLKTYDGTLQLVIQVANLIKFDDEGVLACKLLADECLTEWTADSMAEVRAIVTDAFRLKDGQLNRGKLLGLFRYQFTDPRWIKAMEALRDAISVEGTKAYARFSRRPEPEAEWQNVSLDFATAKTPGIHSAAEAR